MLLDHYLKVDKNGNRKPRMKKVTIKDLYNTAYAKDSRIIEGMYIDDILKLVNRDYTKNGYYTQMAAGWLLAECFVTFPQRTWEYLTDSDNMKLDRVSYKKAIRKICESLTPEKEVKAKVKELLQ